MVIGDQLSNGDVEMAKITLEIGDIQNILLILGKLYSPTDAASEFFANSMDAHAKNIEISFGKDSKGSYILFSDDGDGMNQSDLHRVAKNIGNSIKKIETNPNSLGYDTIGQFGIGILGFVTFGDEMHIISRKNPSESLSELNVNKGNIECSVENSKRKNLKLNKEHGTDIYIYHNARSPLRADHLANHISQKYRNLLLKNPVNAIVKTGKNRPYEIKAMVISGISIIKRTYKTNFGELGFNLYLSNSETKTDPIKIIRKGVIICNLIDIDLFNRPPWNSDKLTGEIIFNSIEITSDRKKLLENTLEFELLKEKILFIEKSVESYLEEQKKAKFESIDKEIKKHLNDIINKALSRLNDPLEIFEKKTPTSETFKFPHINRNSQEVGFLSCKEELIKPPNNPKIPKITTETFDNNPFIKADKSVTLDDFDIDDVQKKPPLFKPKNKPGINWEFNSENFQDEPWKMSKYDSFLNLIYINESHNYWQNIKKSDENVSYQLKMDYILSLTLKEIILFNLKGESKLLTRLFEDNMEKYVRFLVMTKELILKSDLMK